MTAAVSFVYSTEVSSSSCCNNNNNNSSRYSRGFGYRSAEGPLKPVGANSSLSRRDNPISPTVSQTALWSAVTDKGFCLLEADGSSLFL